MLTFHFSEVAVAPNQRRKKASVNRVGGWEMICVALLLFVETAVAVNPVPFVNQPLVPDAAAPGGPGFTLTVNGTGFVAGSVVQWNGSPRLTTYVSEVRLTATIPASDIATVSTAAVTVVNPSPTGVASNTVFFPIAASETSVSFSRTDFSSAGWNINVVTADFNGDGKLDLAVTDYYGLVRIFLGNGDGTFRVGQTYAVCNAHGSALGDFNRDGIVDLAIADAGCGEVTILLGNGDGTFRQAGVFSTGGNATFAPYSVAVGDFNGDGKLDLVTADELLGKASVLIGNGDGTFQTHVDYATQNDSRQVVTGDFNGDGTLDFAVSSSVGVSVLLGNGDGTFQPQVVYPLPAADSPYVYVVAADLSGDGNLDLVATTTSGFVFVLLGKGDGTFKSAVSYPTGGYSGHTAVADFNADGVLDVLTTDYSSSMISLLLGKGDGTFQPAVHYAAGDGARGVAVGDFDGDGRLDVAVGNQFADSISIFLNLPSSVSLTPATLTFASQAIGTFSAVKVATLKNTSGAALKISNISWASGDFYQSNNCPATLLPGASCSLRVTFTPSSSGTKSGNVKISDNAAQSPQTLLLTGIGSGTGAIKLTLSPAALNFGSVAAGATSGPQMVTVKNVGTATANFSAPFGFDTAGADCHDFHNAPQCGTSLAPGASCTASVTFKPTASGTREGIFVVHQGGHTVYIPESGTGTP